MSSIIDSIPKAADYPDAVPRRHTGAKVALLGGLLALLLLVFLVSLAVGSVQIPLDQIIAVLLGGSAEKAPWTNIVLKFRLPKALTAVLAGAALGASGLMMQTLFRNPLAGPFVLGISSGASLGVALVVLSTGTVGVTLLAGAGFGSDLTLAVAAALGAALTMGLVLFAAQRVESTMTLLILGLMLGYLTSAIVSLLIFFSISERIQAYINWTFGSFGSVTWSQMKILAPAVVIGLLVALTTVKSLNALLLGEGYARSMGMRVNRTRTSLVISASLLAGTVTAFCGPIGFIGIAVPHLCRSLFNTSDHRLLLPASMLVGAMVALLAAVIAEVPGHSLVLPLNAITSVIGAPVVIWVVMRYRNAKAAFGS